MGVMSEQSLPSCFQTRLSERKRALMPTVFPTEHLLLLGAFVIRLFVGLFIFLKSECHKRQWGIVKVSC